MNAADPQPVAQPDTLEDARRAAAEKREQLIRQLEKQSLESRIASAKAAELASKPRGILGWLGFETSVG
jgi:hypothetical protein